MESKLNYDRLLTCTEESGLDEVKADEAGDEGLDVGDDVVVFRRHHILQGTHQWRQTETCDNTVDALVSAKVG